MKILDILKMSFRSLWANKMRTGLTVLGVVIGIASIIIVFSAGEGINGLVVGQVQSFGTDFIEVEIKTPTSKKGHSGDSQGAVAMAQGVQITTLNLDDMEEINRLPNIRESYAAITGQEQAGYGSELRKAMLWGVSASFQEIDSTKVAQGRFFTAAEESGLSEVAVLGSKMKEKLFGDSDPLGKSIKIRKAKYKVIGVMEERGAVMGMDYDDLIYIPLITAQKKLLGVQHVLFMISKVENMDLAGETAEEIKRLLRENHDIKEPTDLSDASQDDFRVVTMTEMMEMLDTVTGAMTLLLLAIVIISLIVGGVGITNVMYVIVSERTAEIGLRKAVGAKYRDIITQFLLESVLITIFGGLVGSFFGIGVSFLIYLGAGNIGLDWPFSLPLKAFIIAAVFSIVFGVLFGLYPARKAARLDPVEALRAE